MPSSPEHELLVVTSAGGQQAGHLLPLLNKDNYRLRLVVHSQSSQTRLQKAYPNAEVLIAELTEPSEAVRVLDGATAVYHIGPTFHPFETQIGYNMIKAALDARKANGTFKHFVYSAVIHTQIRKLLNHEAKRFVEEYLIECGLPYTIMKPTHFMEMFPIQALMQDPAREVDFRSWWDPDVEFAFIAGPDLGLAAYKVLTERERHFYASYELCGTDHHSLTDECVIAGKVMGKSITPKLLPLMESVNEFVGMKYGQEVDSYSRDATERLFLYYNRHGLPGNTNILRWLIGQEPMSFEAWAERMVREVSKS